MLRISTVQLVGILFWKSLERDYSLKQNFYFQKGHRVPSKTPNTFGCIQFQQIEEAECETSLKTDGQEVRVKNREKAMVPYQKAAAQNRNGYLRREYNLC